MRVNIKPLSVNEAWKGRRFKTDAYKSYEIEMFFKLPKITVGSEKLSIKIVVGYSNKLADIDNFQKPFIDILQKKYNFNDKQIYELHVYKVITEKGKEFIDFEIDPIIA